jgi:diguanylate cyclase (GGDEF)-like protein
MLAIRESAALPHWAAARLAALWRATGTSVVRVFPIAAARSLDASGHGYAIAAASQDLDVLPEPLPADALLRAAIEGRCLTSAESGTDRRRVLVPLSAGDEVRCVIGLDGAAASGTGASLAEALVPLVESYYDLLVDAETDALTRLANRRVFYAEIGRLLTRPSSLHRYIAVADIDHFKGVNDRFGHLYGDEILIHFARLMRESFRAGDRLYRFGGEEFVIVFAVARNEDRGIGLERFRAAVESYEFPRVGRVTTSIGFAAIEAGMIPATSLIDRADNAVYYAKRNGRNRVCEYEALVEQGAITPATPTSGGEATLF